MSERRSYGRARILGKTRVLHEATLGGTYTARMNRATRLGGVALVIATALVAVACAPATVTGPNTTVTSEPTYSRGPAPTPPPDPRPGVVWPLTGLDAGEASELQRERPALSIKIENTEAARPQTNLELADVVFEEYVEYGISRLIAVYQSNYPESVGPIRSMRPMDRHIMSQFGGPIVFSGAQRRFIVAAQESGLVTIAEDVGSYGFFRAAGKPAPHNLHGYLEDFQEQSRGATAPDPQWAFAYPSEFASATMDGKATSDIRIRMSSYAQPHWKWDADSGLWLRYERDVPHKVASGDQLSATNVVMLWVTVRYTSSIPGGMSVPETLVSRESGSGYIATGGKYLPIKWSKDGQFDPFVFTTKEGDAVEFAPGQTWVELVPNEGVGHATGIEFS